MQGNLSEISVSDLVQLNCQDAKTAMLQIVSNARQAKLYFKDGRVVHAAAGDLQGEEAVYQVLNWTEGSFGLLMNEEADSESIQRSWPSLLLEGARQADESKAAEKPSVSQSADLPPDQASVEALLVEASSQLPEMITAALFRADGREMASYSPSAAGPDEHLGEELAAYAEEAKAKLGEAGIEKASGHLISSYKESLLIRFFDEGARYLVLKVAHSSKDRIAVGEKLHSLGETVGNRIQQALKLPAQRSSPNDSLIFINAQGRVAFANRYLLSVLSEKKLSDIIDQPLHELLRTDPRVIERLTADLNKKGVVRKRIFKIKQGAEIVSCSAIATFDDKGEFLEADVFLQFINAPEGLSPESAAQPEIPDLADYLAAQLGGLHSYLKNVAGARLANKLSMSINETAERGGWPVQISDDNIEVGADVKTEACAALMAKALIICNKAVGPKITRKQIEKQNAKFGERAQQLSAAIGATGLLPRL